VHGLLVVDKPAGLTSHDVVDRCRRAFGQKRVGHAGTLDPDATGVLLVGLGQVTRLLRFLAGFPKRYTGEVVLGVSTTTLDAAGETTRTWDMTGVTLADARAAAARLSGVIMQVPPMVSALKVGGRRLHELAREGVVVERAPRPVTVSRFDVDLAGAGEHGPVLAIDVECSSGTYVRTLAADLGGMLGGGAHLRHLRRLAVGNFTVDEAVPLEDLEAAPAERRAHLLFPPAEAVRGMARVKVGGELAGAVSHGRIVPMSAFGVDGPEVGPWAVLGPTGELLAVYETSGEGQAKPAVVLALP
jgi:tRNA pseudouridine55 synthase